MLRKSTAGYRREILLQLEEDGQSAADDHPTLESFSAFLKRRMTTVPDKGFEELGISEAEIKAAIREGWQRAIKVRRARDILPADDEERKEG